MPSLVFTGVPSSCSVASRSRLPFAKDSFDQSTSAGLPAEEKPGCQARSRVRELRDVGSTVDLSRDRVQRVRRQVAAVRPTGCEIRSLTIDVSRMNVTSFLDALSSFTVVDVQLNAETVIFSHCEKFTFFSGNIDVKKNTRDYSESVISGW